MRGDDLGPSAARRMFDRARELVDEVAGHALLERRRRGRGWSRSARGSRRTGPPARPSCPHRRYGRRGRACSAPRCARRRRRCPCPASRSKPSIDRRRHVTPQARMIVRARRTSPPSRWTLTRRGVDPRDRPRHEDLGAEPSRLLQRAARRAHRRTRPTGSRGSSRSATTCPAWPPGASRSTTIVRRPSEAPYTAAARPGGPGSDDDRVVLGAGAARSRVPAARQPAVAAGGRRSCRRRRGSPGSLRRRAADRPTARPRPAHPGGSHLNVIWLRSRKRRSSVHAASQR